MASSSGTLSGSGEKRAAAVDTRKRKRMLSNRESARRSRMRKQKHLDDLVGQMANLTAENHRILNDIDFATHRYMNMESENSVLRAQVSVLSHRLQALSDIITRMSSNDALAPGLEMDGCDDQMVIGGLDDLWSPWSLVHVNQPQPIMAPSNLFMY